MKKFGDIIKNSKKNADEILWTKCRDLSKYNYPKNLAATAFSSSFFYIFLIGIEESLISIPQIFLKLVPWKKK